MTSSVDYNLEGIGIMLFGIKKSGNTFSTQDKRVISIISSELTIATQNALRFEEIENFSATLQGKVDDATKRLKRANEKLQTLDETKDEFISMASHQLRTPLTSVKGYVSMVLEGDAGPLNDMQRKLLEQSFISSQRMVFLIADLLNLSRLKTGRFVIENVACNLAEVIEGEVMQLKETAAGKNLTLTYKAPKKFPTLMLDETKIRQVIMNFVDNAIYYTPSGGKIEITLVEAEKTIEFTVKDNGIGVPDAEQHHLFNKFYRAKNAQKARPDGTGLGLFMSKKVIIAQGGALIFSSSVGKGSTFGFSFAKSKLALSEIKTAQ
jgi:signal transduction histidine kinase